MPPHLIGRTPSSGALATNYENTMQTENDTSKPKPSPQQRTGEGCPGASCSSSFVATVEWIRGNRLVSTVMRNAGLGLTGVGVKERVNISYKPGEIVTEERVMKAVQSMIDQSNAENAEFEISCPRVIRIFETNIVIK